MYSKITEILTIKYTNIVSKSDQNCTKLELLISDKPVNHNFKHKKMQALQECENKRNKKLHNFPLIDALILAKCKLF